MMQRRRRRKAGRVDYRAINDETEDDVDDVGASSDEADLCRDLPAYLSKLAESASSCKLTTLTPDSAREWPSSGPLRAPVLVKHAGQLSAEQPAGQGLVAALASRKIKVNA